MLYSIREEISGICSIESLDMNYYQS